MSEIYKRRGKRNYREVRMMNDLEKALSKKFEEDPEFAKSFVPAKDEKELKALHNKYCVTDVEYTETKTPEMAKIKDKDVEDVSFTETKNDTTQTEEYDDSDVQANVDPFNRDSPIVRDYVLGGDSLGRNRTKPDESRSDFNEPTSFKEAFEIPSYDDEGNEIKSDGQPSSGNSKGQSQERKEPKQPKESFNPAADDLSSGKRRKNAKKNARNIIDAVALLTSKGFVWYANKDITAEKLAEYQNNGEIDLDILLQLDQEQQITVRDFFQMQCTNAEQLSEISEAEKDAWANDLAEVMLEKNIVLTPTQELLLTTANIIGQKAILLISIKAQTNAVLNQLRQMRATNATRFDAEIPVVEKEEVVQPKEQPAAPAAEAQVVEFDSMDQVINGFDAANVEVGETVETKE